MRGGRAPIPVDIGPAVKMFDSFPAGRRRSRCESRWRQHNAEIRTVFALYSRHCCCCCFSYGLDTQDRRCLHQHSLQRRFCYEWCDDILNPAAQLRFQEIFLMNVEKLRVFSRFFRVLRDRSMSFHAAIKKVTKKTKKKKYICDLVNNGCCQRA